MDLKRTREFSTHLFSIFSWRCVGLSAAAMLATFFCMRMGWVADYPMALIGTAVIFPIVFSINSAYTRREEALHHYAVIKSNLRSLYFAMRNWNGPLPEKQLSELRHTISAPLFAIRGLITEPVDELRTNEPAVYQSFSGLSVALEKQARCKNFTGAEAAACSNYLNAMMGEFEALKHVYQYRTPRALQAFSDVFITVLPVLYAPVFAAIALKIENPYLAFLVPALFAFVLSSLDNIQADLEDPFDGIGVDDMVISAEVFLETLSDGPVIDALDNSDLATELPAKAETVDEALPPEAENPYALIQDVA